MTAHSAKLMPSVTSVADDETRGLRTESASVTYQCGAHPDFPARMNSFQVEKIRTV
jgi:hypothetical protein